MKYSQNRDVDRLLVEAERRGAEITRRKKNHLRVVIKDRVIFVSATPSDYNAVRNIEADLRRAFT